MELREHTISVLRGHGAEKMSKAFLYTVELVDTYLTDSTDLLASKMFLDAAQRHGIQKRSLTTMLWSFAQQLKKTDPEWYQRVFPGQLNPLDFIKAISQETLASCQASIQSQPPEPKTASPHKMGQRPDPANGSSLGGTLTMQATGTLSVRVYTSQAQIPLAGATVVVAAPGEEGKYKLLSIQNTDSSGLIRPITIDAPALGESTSPGGLPGTGAPFSLCDVWAEQQGYAMLQVSGVQIFPGVETMQDMELIPLPQGLCSLQKRGERDIPAQSL